MIFQFINCREDELSIVLSYLKIAAEQLNSKNVNQWQFWLNPSNENIQWVEEGVTKGEFYFVLNQNNYCVGMIRLMNEDELYWGIQSIEARYIHSLVVLPEYSGQQIGTKIIRQIEKELAEKNISLLRLDCNASNPWLCGYYENIGFQKVGEVQMPHSLNNLYEKTIR